MTRKKSIWQQMRESRIAYLYILPATIVMAVITAYPIGFQIWMSFTNYRLANLNPRNPPAAYVGLDNYANIITSNLPITNYDFWRLLVFNIWWALSNVILHLTIGVIIALVLNRKRLFGRRFYRALFLIPWALPAFVASLVWRNMYNTEFGAINMLLGREIPWLETWATDPIPFLPFLPLAYFAALITNVWLGWPFMSVVATGALQSVPQEMYEAAEVDGASKWEQFWNVTVPSIRPAMVPAIMLGLIWTFNQFNVIYFITQGSPYGRTEILVTQAFKLVNPGGLYGIASAFSIVVFFILLGITLLTNRITRATESSYD
ncbi:MAG TPA: sugar ABC transporter permease [Chloroflexia bacterium]|nr:sugar ABC transporter permease [Chloroflexia bacterium]